MAACVAAVCPLSYSTTRVVEIRDRRLGLLYNAILCAVFVYVVVDKMLLGKAYLGLQPAQGTVRMQLKAPAAQFLLPPSQLPYCLSPTAHSNSSAAGQHPCLYLDEYRVAYPAERSMLAVSRISQQTHVQPDGGCSPPTSPRCLMNASYSVSQTYLVAQLERYTVLVDHSLVAASSSFTSKHMHKGQLLDAAGQPMDPCDDYPLGQCPSYVHVGTPGSYDIVPLASLLRAAGVESLDAPSDAAAHATLRHAGCVLLLHVHYDNTRTWDTAHYEYTWRVERVRGSEFKAVERGDAQGVNGTRENRHGINLVVVFSGQVGTFDFQTLLVNLAGGAGLLAMGAVIVDFIALYLAPDAPLTGRTARMATDRRLYSQCKYLSTVDFQAARISQPAPDGGLHSPLLQPSAVTL